MFVSCTNVLGDFVSTIRRQLEWKYLAPLFEPKYLLLHHLKTTAVLFLFFSIHWQQWYAFWQKDKLFRFSTLNLFVLYTMCVSVCVRTEIYDPGTVNKSENLSFSKNTVIFILSERAFYQLKDDTSHVQLNAALQSYGQNLNFLLFSLFFPTQME